MSLFQPVLEAAIAPAVALLLLGLTAAVISSRDARRRDPVRRFTREQRRREWHVLMDSASSAWALVAVPVLPSMVTTSTPGPRAGRRRCRTSSRRAAGATGSRVRGSPRRACSGGSNDGAWLRDTTGRTFWSASAGGSRRSQNRLGFFRELSRQPARFESSPAKYSAASSVSSSIISQAWSKTPR